MYYFREDLPLLRNRKVLPVQEVFPNRSSLGQTVVVTKFVFVLSYRHPKHAVCGYQMMMTESARCFVCNLCQRPCLRQRMSGHASSYEHELADE
jgi:hypothetical protein